VFPFTFIFLLVTPFEDSGYWFLAFNFTDCIASAFASSATVFLVLLTPFIIGAFALFAITSLLIAIVVITVVFE
jgi:hypothetical protein